MKNLKIFKIITAILMINILTSCASIPANKVKLSDYAEVKKEEIKQLDLSYQNINFGKKAPFNLEESFAKHLNNGEIKSVRNFDKSISNQFENNFVKQNQQQNTGCVVKFSSYKDEQMDGVCGIYYPITFFTLFIIPYYCQNNFEARATLISTSNNKTLKEYYLKDKAHEYWSLIATLGELTVALIYPPAFKNSNIQTPESANAQIEQTISEALTRQILNDAATFPECQKK